VAHQTPRPGPNQRPLAFERSGSGRSIAKSLSRLMPWSARGITGWQTGEAGERPGVRGARSVGSPPRVNTASRWRRRPKVAGHRATPGGYGGKPPGVAFIGVPTGARNAGRCSDGGPEHRYACYTETPPCASRPDYKQIWPPTRALGYRSAVSRLLFSPCFLAKRPGRRRPGRRHFGSRPPSRPSGCVRGGVALGQPGLVGTKTSGAGRLTAAVSDHYGEIGDGDSAHGRNRSQPARAPDEQGNRGPKTSDPDSHHDQVAARPRRNVRGQRRLRLGDEVRPVAVSPRGGFHIPNVRPRGAAGECGFPG
jgi:hypothetical protein